MPTTLPSTTRSQEQTFATGFPGGTRRGAAQDGLCCAFRARVCNRQRRSEWVWKTREGSGKHECPDVAYDPATTPERGIYYFAHVFVSRWERHAPHRRGPCRYPQNRGWEHPNRYHLISLDLVPCHIATGCPSNRVRCSRTLGAFRWRPARSRCRGSSVFECRQQSREVSPFRGCETCHRGRRRIPGPGSPLVVCDAHTKIAMVHLN
jgi:hypothetical protein